MRQVLLVATAALVGVTTTSCDFLSGLGGGNTTTTASPTVSAVPVPVPTASPQASPFSQPTVPERNQPKGILPADLISSTDPNQRVQQVKGNRVDPFALLPTTPTVQLPPGATATTGGTGVVTPGAVPQANPTGGGQTTNRPTGTANRTPNRATGTANRTPNQTPQARSGSTAPTGQAAPKPSPKSPIASPVPRPDPAIARAVEVTGIIQIGDQAYAIVNAPNEPTSRYVQAGQRLAGGQVLVRRIDFNRAEPVVILEQSGVEVVRAVGEGGAAATSTESAPAT
jgi:hypothetical protein